MVPMKKRVRQSHKSSKLLVTFVNEVFSNLKKAHFVARVWPDDSLLLSSCYAMKTSVMSYVVKLASCMMKRYKNKEQDRKTQSLGELQHINRKKESSKKCDRFLYCGKQ